MYAGKRILALIPARGGSKGIKDKNITLLAGKPLIAYTIEAAAESRCIDAVIVTTDSKRIAEIARQFGAEVPFLRPAELASDSAKTIDAVAHALDSLANLGQIFDVLILLQPTQPFRTVDDINNAIEMFFVNQMDSLVSVSLVDEHPLLMRTIDGVGHLNNLLPSISTCRRQDFPTYYRVNGCIYINKVSEIDKSTSFNDNLRPYIMDKSHSIDIDEPMDIEIAEYLLSQKQGGSTK